MDTVDWSKLPKKEMRRLKRAQERKEKERRARKGRLMKWGLVLGIVALVVGGIFLFKFSEASRYANAPRLEVAPLSYDFGKVSLGAGKVEKGFTVKNAGASDLVISGIKTSCDCTTALLKVKEPEGGRVKESPVFGMHNTQNWSATLAPGETAELVVIYDPKVHPELGPVARTVSIFSNDSGKEEERVTIYADVQP